MVCGHALMFPKTRKNTFTAQDAGIHRCFKLGITWLRPPAPSVEPLEKEACADRFRVLGADRGCSRSALGCWSWKSCNGDAWMDSHAWRYVEHVDIELLKYHIEISFIIYNLHLTFIIYI